MAGAVCNAYLDKLKGEAYEASPASNGGRGLKQLQRAARQQHLGRIARQQWRARIETTPWPSSCACVQARIARQQWRARIETQT